MAKMNVIKLLEGLLFLFVSINLHSLRLFQSFLIIVYNFIQYANYHNTNHWSQNIKKNFVKNNYLFTH